MDFKATKNITLQQNMVEDFSKDDRLVNLGRGVEGITGNDASGIAPVAAKPDKAQAPENGKAQSGK
jgi:hypothetical protein